MEVAGLDLQAHRHQPVQWSFPLLGAKAHLQGDCARPAAPQDRV